MFPFFRQASMLKDKLLALGARFAQFQGVEAASEYRAGAIAEYQATKHAVALMERSFIGRIELQGADRFDFLQRMSTNDMRNLKAGDGLQTVLTTAEAKIIDLLTVYVQPESLLCLTSPQNRSKALNWFRRNIFFRDKVKPVDVSDGTAQLSLFGPRAGELLGLLAQGDFASLPSCHSLNANIAGVETLVARLPHVIGNGYDLICAAASVEMLWDVVMDAGTALGITPMGIEAFNHLRIGALQPLYGFELSEEYNPLEAGLNDAISFSKGCYTGQEVIARLDTYRKLKQNLVRLRLSVLPVAALPLPLQVDGVEIGVLTSAAQLPDTGEVVGLGYVRVRVNQTGAVARVMSDDEDIQATLMGMPYLSAEAVG